ncbi:MAG TPA: signal peptide peptidase SppA, partial [Deferrisomatales bacterium]|nr:signal peptide peptidase SppA [Deferrisomatales bacterium]
TLLGDGEAKVLMVDVSGMLSFRRPWALPGMPQGESLPARVRQDLDRARKDPAVRALLVRIDSPGGTVTSSDVVFHEIRSFRDETGVPVVAAIVEKGLSGGYYVALAADEIVAHPTALVGSVGVFVTKLDASQLLARWGVRSETTKSGPQKDILSPLRPLTTEEQQTLDQLVGELAGRFEETVRAARPDADEEDLAKMRSAAPFTASRALELHMIDRIGYLEDAFEAATRLAEVEQARLVAYRRSSGEGAGPYSLGSLAGALEAEGTRFLFLDPAWLEELGQTELRY